MNITAIDIETPLISYEDPTPEPVCISYATSYEREQGISLWGKDTAEDILHHLNIKGSYVGHNIAFDLSLMCIHYPELWKFVFSAYDEGRIHDTLIREKLLNLTDHGNLTFKETKHKKIKLKYGLADLEIKYLGIDRHELKENDDSPRYNYGKLKGISIDEWPPEAVKYSIDDSVNCLSIYFEQEKEREMMIMETGIDPFKVESFRNRAAFALRLIECRGSRLDPEKVLEITKHYKDLYNDPDLINPLIEAGLLELGKPPQPYAKGTKEHKETCIHNKNHKDYKAGRKQNCDCPPKMKAGTKDKMPTKTLHQYVWSLSYQEVVEAWPSEKSKEAGFTEDKYFTGKVREGRKYTREFINETQGILPKGVTLTCNEEWFTSFADKDSLLQKYSERKALQKIVSDYLPKFYYKGKPAERMRGSYDPLKLTGRCSCRSTDCYASRNEQNVDPRVRPCTIPEDGNVIISTDFSVMELGTLAQKCYDLFGHSVLRDKINAGIDVHAYLGAQIAVNMDEDFNHILMKRGYSPTNPEAVFDAFQKCKGSDRPCQAIETCNSFSAQYRAEHNEYLNRDVTWDDFFNFYRKLAKPTDLGFPGGLGPSTMVIFAKGTYKTNMTEEVARKCREVWLETLPEMELYLNWVNRDCRDPHHKAIYVEIEGKKKLQPFYCYDTPLGMHRARCKFTEAANGAGLQAFAAEGALGALYEVCKAMYLAPKTSVLGCCFPINFIHDEILWECPEDKYIGHRIDEVDNLMVNAMEKITPDVKARTESVVMRRWYKEAKPVFDDNGKIIPWEPEENGHKA